MVKNGKVVLKLYSDSSAARGTIQRLGHGRMKHVAIKYLWIQELLKRKNVKLLRVPTAENVSDLNAKKLSAERRKYLMSLIPMGLEDGEDFEKVESAKEVSRGQVLRIVMSLLSIPTGLDYFDYYSVSGPFPGQMMIILLVILAAFLIAIILVQREQLNHMRAAIRQARPLIWQQRSRRERNVADEDAESETHNLTPRTYEMMRDDRSVASSRTGMRSRSSSDRPGIWGNTTVLPDHDEVPRTDGLYDRHPLPQREGPRDQRRFDIFGDPVYEEYGEPGEIGGATSDVEMDRTSSSEPEAEAYNEPEYQQVEREDSSDSVSDFVNGVPRNEQEFRRYRVENLALCRGPEHRLTMACHAISCEIRRMRQEGNTAEVRELSEARDI